MSEETQRNGKSFDWRTVAVTGALIIGQGLIQWGITSTTLTDHSRRLDLLEKRMEERSVARDEYERRHSDLQDKVREQETRLRELERKIH